MTAALSKQVGDLFVAHSGIITMQTCRVGNQNHTHKSMRAQTYLAPNPCLWQMQRKRKKEEAEERWRQELKARAALVQEQQARSAARKAAASGGGKA
jgi:hypothetical protein